MKKQWLEHFCKYRHICEFLGNEGKEKEEIKEYLMYELGLPEATARYQMQRALEDEAGIVKSFGWKFYLDEEKFKAVIEDLRSIYPIRLKPYPYPPKEETEARDGLMELKRKYKSLELEYDLLRYRYLETLAWYYDAKSDLAEAQVRRNSSSRFWCFRTVFSERVRVCVRCPSSAVRVSGILHSNKQYTLPLHPVRIREEPSERICF